MAEAWTIARARAALGEAAYQLLAVVDTLDSLKVALSPLSPAESPDRESPLGLGALAMTCADATDSLRAIIKGLQRGDLRSKRRPMPENEAWIEADSIRETTLICLDDPEDKEAVRRVGRLLYNLAVETTSFPGDESITHAEMRAAAVDLRFTEGFLRSVRQSADDSALAPADNRLAHFAAYVARKVGALALVLEERLS